MKIRIATPKDIFEIAEIYADSVSELCKNDYKAEIIKQWVSSTPAEARLQSIEEKSLWVADINGKIGGYLVSIPGELIALFIGSSYSGLGIGRKLGLLGIEIARNNDSGEVRLESTITAAPFYEKLGFKVVDRGYFSHGNSEFKIPVINMYLPRICS